MELIEKQVIEFWKLSESKPNIFDFNIFINEFRGLLFSKLARHGQLTCDDYINSISYLYNFNSLEQFVFKSEHTNNQWTLDNIKKLIFCPRYEHFRKTFKGNKRYIKLVELYWKLLNKEYDNKNIFVDECIHALHNSGFLIDIESLRKQYES